MKKSELEARVVELEEELEELRDVVGALRIRSDVLGTSFEEFRAFVRQAIPGKVSGLDLARSEAEVKLARALCDREHAVPHPDSCRCRECFARKVN